MTDSTELKTTSPQDEFRARASDIMIEAATLSLHGLVDEFQRLTGLMAANLEPAEDDNYGPHYNHVGQVALRHRDLIRTAARARFGLDLDAFDQANSLQNF